MTHSSPTKRATSTGWTIEALKRLNLQMGTDVALVSFDDLDYFADDSICHCDKTACFKAGECISSSPAAKDQWRIQE